MLRRVANLIASAVALSIAAGPALAQCVLDPEPCRGCGCKGGPGYREIASGRCVGFRDMPKKCGNPPSLALCSFENAPGTGANRECALAPKNGKRATLVP
jgi:hypothetical protein